VDTDFEPGLVTCAGSRKVPSADLRNTAGSLRVLLTAESASKAFECVEGGLGIAEYEGRPEAAAGIADEDALDCMGADTGRLPMIVDDPRASSGVAGLSSAEE